MDEERKTRYREKIEFILEKSDNIPLIPDTPLERDAAFYRLQVAIEGITDVSAMLVKDIGKTVGDDYHNIDILIEEGIVSGEFGAYLKRLNGLRNILVHRYNKVEEKLIFENMGEIIKNITKFLEIVENVIKRF